MKTLSAPGICVFSASVAMALALGGAFLHAQQGMPSEQPDKYTWLEDVHGERPMAWVKDHDARTAAVIEKDPRFAQLAAEDLRVLDSPERLPFPEFHGDVIFNQWQDAQHVRGIYRRTSLDDYMKAEPDWHTIVDVDALSREENKSWVSGGVGCLPPEDHYCLLALSEGGEDAYSARELDMSSGKFAQDGFVLPRGKQTFTWIDPDTMLVGRDWGPGTMSDSGYPITLRIWKRGQPLNEAREVFRAQKSDNGGVSPSLVVDGKGNRAVLFAAGPDIQNARWYILHPDGPKQFGLPLRSQYSGFVDGQLIFTLNEDWTPEGSSQLYKEGTIVSFNLDDVNRDAQHLQPTVVFAPTAAEFAQQTGNTRNDFLLTTLANVQGRAYVYTHSSSGWTRKALPVPDNQSVNLGATTAAHDRFFLSVEGYITPPSLWLGEASDGTLRKVKEQKPLFDASQLVVEQREATSKDGTRIPYFIVHRKDMPYDGNNPTLMTAYGGFQISITPSYSADVGKLWMERGGVFVTANIRGGGEFGPAWHEAGLKTHRQRIYDDFYAVAQDLVTRKITSPRRLGIMGESNGGLLMGVEFTQHPEMWNAVVIGIPLLDMLNYEHLSAGASWVGEYGSVSVPEERRFLASISPYNQLKPGVKYPEPFIFTTTKDDRVGPVQARKFAARMEEFHEPFFYDEITEGGHGAGADNRQQARTQAEIFTYLSMKLID